MTTAILLLALLGAVESTEERDTLLYVATSPPGAEVLVDGKRVGTTDGLFPIEPGVRRIIVELDGHDQQGKDVTIRAGDITRLKLRLKRRPETNVDNQTSYSVRLVVGSDGMTFQGQKTNWQQLPGLLKRLPDREHTILALAAASSELGQKTQEESLSKVIELAHRLGFAYASYIGVHPLGSTASTAQAQSRGKSS